MFAIVKIELRYYRNVLLTIYVAIIIFFSMPVPMDKTGYSTLIATAVILHAYLFVMRRKGKKERLHNLVPVKREALWLSRVMFQTLATLGVIISVAIPLLVFHPEITGEALLMRLLSLLGLNLIYIIMTLSWTDTKSIARNSVSASIYPVLILVVWLFLYLCYLSSYSLGFMMSIFSGSESAVYPFVNFDQPIAPLSVLVLSALLLIVEHELYKKRPSYLDAC